MIGGFSKALELMIIANAAGLPIEIQSWDHSLSQAANLLKQGQIVAPEGPGLGIDVDWDRLDTADFYRRAKEGQ